MPCLLLHERVSARHLLLPGHRVAVRMLVLLSGVHHVWHQLHCLLFDDHRKVKHHWDTHRACQKSNELPPTSSSSTKCGRVFCAGRICRYAGMFNQRRRLRLLLLVGFGAAAAWNGQRLWRPLDDEWYSQRHNHGHDGVHRDQTHHVLHLLICLFRGSIIADYCWHEQPAVKHRRHRQLSKC